MRNYISLIAFILIGVVFYFAVIAVDSHIITIDTLKYGAIAIVAVCVPFIAKAIIDHIRGVYHMSCYKRKLLESLTTNKEK